MKTRAHNTIHKDFYGRVSVLFFKHDPINVNYDDDTDEYDPETGSVVPRLKSCQNAQDVELVLHEEFGRWFGADIAGPRGRYSPIAAKPLAALAAMQGEDI